MPADPSNIPITNVDSQFRIYTNSGPYSFDPQIPENVPFIRDGDATTDLDGRVTDDLVRKIESRDNQAILKKVFYYPEEIGNISDSSYVNGYDTPRHALKISILDYYGAKIDSLDSILKVGKDTFNGIMSAASSGGSIGDIAGNVIGSLVPGAARLATNESRRVQQRSDSLRGGSDVLNSINGSHLSSQQRDQYRSQIQEWLESPEGQRFSKSYLSTANHERPFVDPPANILSQSDVKLKLLPDDIKSIIYLYATGDNLNYTYNTSWKAIEMFNGLESMLNSLALLGQDKTSEAGSSLIEGTIGILSNYLKSTGDNSTGDVIRAMLAAKTGMVPADNYEYLFESVKRRSFGVSTVFMPKSRKEIESVAKIIAALKYYAHPARPDMKYFYRVPAVFLLENITYTPKKGWVENVFLPRYKVAALTNFNVKYDQDGTLITHEDIESLTTQTAAFKSPVKIEVSMTFEELNILTREDMTDPTKFFDGDTSKGYY